MSAPDATADAAALDPITFSVLLNRLNSIATEMTIALERAAMTSILALCRDYSCCIYDREKRQIAVVDAIPIHTNSMHLMLAEIESELGADILDGDIIACNFSYSGNTHIGDLVTVAPVFVDGEILFWAAVRAHQLDVGAPHPSTAYAWSRDIWQEGFKIPPLKMVEAGRRRADVINLYLTNMRWRDALEGDLLAMFGALGTARRRLTDLCGEFGVDVALRFLDEVIRYAGRRTKAEIRTMPNGVYRGEGWLDTDGLDEMDIPIRCTLTIEDEAIAVDFDGSAPQVRTIANATEAVMQAAGGIPVMMAIDPDIPHNQGALGCVSVSAPVGSICNAAFPAATASATTQPGDLMQDVVSRALAQAVPDRLKAGGAHWANVPVLSGHDPRTGAHWGHMLLNDGGGGGAANGADGWPLITTTASLGGLKTASVEHTELLYPLRFKEWELEPSSMGLGEYIGGPGIRCSFEVLEGEVQVLGRSDALRNPPYGVAGGEPGRGGGHYLDGADGARRVLPLAFHFRLQPGETWTGVSTGGGGFGDPLSRPAEQVRVDVRDGFYDRARAQEVFGVHLSDDPDPVVLEPATSEAREELSRLRSESQRPVVLPLAPAASTWVPDGPVLPLDSSVGAGNGVG